MTAPTTTTPEAPAYITDKFNHMKRNGYVASHATLVAFPCGDNPCPGSGHIYLGTGNGHIWKVWPGGR